MPFDRLAEGGPCGVEKTVCVQIRAVLDTVLRKLLTRDFSGYVKQHDMPQVTRLLIRCACGGVDCQPNVVKQGMRCFVKQHLSARPSVVTVVAARDHDMRTRVD